MPVLSRKSYQTKREKKSQLASSSETKIPSLYISNDKKEELKLINKKNFNEKVQSSGVSRMSFTSHAHIISHNAYIFTQLKPYSAEEQQSTFFL